MPGWKWPPRWRGSGRAWGGECEAAGWPSRSRAARPAPSVPSPPLGGSTAGSRDEGAPRALPAAPLIPQGPALHGHRRTERGCPHTRLSGCPAALHTCVLGFKHLDAPSRIRACGCSGSQLLRATGCTARDPRSSGLGCASLHIPRAACLHHPLLESPWQSGLVCPWICAPLPIQRHIPQILRCRDLCFCVQGCLRCGHTHTAPEVPARFRKQAQGDGNTGIPKLGWISTVFPPFL